MQELRLAAMADDELLRLAPDPPPAGAWGGSGPATLDGELVFVKRVPVTDVELAHPRDTRNLFRLPPYYSYGVGSAGLCVWRELAMHERTSGQPGFPRLLHHRMLPRTVAPGELPWSRADYVRYWNGSEAVGRYLEARQRATHELWIVLEHVPHVAASWIGDHQERAGELLGQLFDRTAALRDRGVVHFDAHLGNAVTDGESCRLTDFGLAMADDFDLRADERRFLDRHRHYDDGVVLASFGMTLGRAAGYGTDAAGVARAIDGLADRTPSYHPAFVDVAHRYRAAIVSMVGVFDRLRRPAKRARYDDRELRALLPDRCGRMST